MLVISDIDLLKSKLMSVKSFQEHAASIDTAYNNEYEPTHSHFGKLHNHCGCVAYTNQKLFGGKIVSMRGHYWNMFSLQTGRSGRRHFHQFDTTTPELRPVYSVHRVCPPRKTINPEKFYDRVVSLLHEYPEFL